jgi:hypothetical protein
MTDTLDLKIAEGTYEIEVQQICMVCSNVVRQRF